MLRWIQVKGDSDAARALRVGLREQGFAVVDSAPTFTIEMSIHASAGLPVMVDSIDGPIEREIVRHIRLRRNVFIQQEGGVQRDDHIVIRLPAFESDADRDVASAIVTACAGWVDSKQGPRKRGFLQRMTGR